MGKRTPTTIPASYLVLEKNGEVLLLRRANTGYQDGKYSLPAGHVELGESFTLALIREMREEIGIDLTPKDVEVRHILHRKSEDGSERVDAFFVARKWEGKIQNLEPEKCADLTWYPYANLPADTIPYIRHAIEHIFSGTFYNEDGWSL